MYKFPVIELVDRYCIAKLKFAKLGDNKDNSVASELQQQGGRKLYPGMYIFEEQSKYFNIVLTTNQQLSSDLINLNQ